ncbi:MAG: retroviral-like aspartic protease family protein [Bacteroidetes bacterium]|nr:retroviral-like aspartic protease family protein [Bacteroidota bacterium]
MRGIIIISLTFLILLTTPIVKGQLLQSYGHTSRIVAFSFSPDGKRLISGSCDPNDYSYRSHYLIIADLGRKTTEFLAAKDYSCSPLAILPDNRTLIFEGQDHTLQYWDISQGNLLGSNAGKWEDFLAFSPNGKYLALKGEGNTIKVLDASNLGLINTFPGRAFVGFSFDGEKLLAESFGRIMQLWSIRENVLIKSLEQIDYPYNQLPSVTSDLTYLATSKDQAIQIWDINRALMVNNIPHTLIGQFGPIIALSNSGDLVAAGSQQKIFVWETFSGKLVTELSLSDDLKVSNLMFSPNGQYLASASTSGARIETKNSQTESNLQGNVHIWNIEDDIFKANSDSEVISASPGSTQTIKMSKENGVYKVPCKINGLSLSFIIDTGASEVSISLTEALFMLKNGYLAETDIKGVEKYRIANGQIAEGTKVILRSIKLGQFEINDVEATVLHNINSPLLFGLSALKRFGKIELDYDQQTIKLGR